MADEICAGNSAGCRKSRFFFLLITLMGLMVIEPLLFDATGIKFLLDIFLSAILLTSIYAVSEKKQVAIIAILLAVPKFASTWILIFITHPLLHLLDAVFGIIFMAYIIILILAHIFKQKDVSIETIYGAIVVFILIGLMWAFLYHLTEIIHPQSFTFAAEHITDLKKSLFYFSFVTLTTLGYGDITPVSSPAKSLAMLEAIVGQMYIAVLIARLVGTHISQSLLKNGQ